MRAIERVLVAGPTTPDLGGKGSTRDMGLAMVDALD
jgi:tartrate dehydrogenase/decarboxylase/D-malate dehydrogenase